jgi:hypothetical protein
MRRRCGGRGENHVRFQRVAVVKPCRGEPGRQRMTLTGPISAHLTATQQSSHGGMRELIYFAVSSHEVLQ